MNSTQNKNTIKSVVFDLDGTLLDTSEGVLSSVKKMLDHMGYDIPDAETMKSFIGPPINKNLERLYNLAPEDAMDAMTYFRSEYPKGDIYKAEHYEGMEELLQSLKENGFHVGVATYKREDMAQTLLEQKGLAKYFDVIHGSNAASDMSKADIVNLTIRDLGAGPEETVMIGDSDNDAVGAEGAGALFIGVTYGFGFDTADNVKSFKNIGVASTPKEVLDIIMSF